MAGRIAGQGMNWIRLSTRLAIYARDGFTCVYCGACAESHGVGLTLDHIVACERGGDNSPENLVTCCNSCNSSKQDATVRAWYAALRERGIDTAKVGRRVRALVARPIDREEGRRLLALRKAYMSELRDAK